MSRPLVYHYYGGKAGVFIGALQQTGDDVVAAVAKAGMDDPDNWLTAGLGAFFDHIQANPIGLTALYRHGSLTGRENRQVLDEIGDRVLRLILSSLDPPGDSPVLQSVLRGWIAMVETMARGWLRRGQPHSRGARGPAARTAARRPRDRGLARRRDRRGLAQPAADQASVTPTIRVSSEVTRKWHQSAKTDRSPGRLP